MMSFLKNLKKWNKENDIKTKYPGYFNKKIIRTMAVAIMLLAFAMVFSIDEEATIFIECPENSPLPCKNMMYECKNNTNTTKIIDFENNTNIEITMNYKICEQYKHIPCKGELCQKQFLEPGEGIGEKPPFLQRNFFTIWLLIMLVGFGCNHIVYTRRKNEDKLDSKDEQG